MMKKIVIRLVCATVALTAGAAVSAGDGAFAVDSEGQVHGITTETWSSSQQVGGTRLVHLHQAPDGTRMTDVVPSTDDPYPDREPALALHPVDGHPVIVWGRSTGAGFDLYASQFVGGAWSPATPVFAGTGDKHQPTLSAGFRAYHVTWHERSPNGLLYYRAALDPATLEPIWGPEPLLRPDDESLLPPSGQTDSIPEPTSPPREDYFYSTGTFLGETPEDPGAIVIWGVQDEPIPIDYMQGFELPGELSDVRDPLARFTSGRFTLTFNDGGRLYYTMFKDGLWTDVRVIVLDENTSVDDAEARVDELIRREVRAAAE